MGEGFGKARITTLQEEGKRIRGPVVSVIVAGSHGMTRVYTSETVMSSEAILLLYSDRT